MGPAMSEWTSSPIRMVRVDDMVSFHFGKNANFAIASDSGIGKMQLINEIFCF